MHPGLGFSDRLLFPGAWQTIDKCCHQHKAGPSRDAETRKGNGGRHRALDPKLISKTRAVRSCRDRPTHSL